MYRKIAVLAFIFLVSLCGMIGCEGRFVPVDNGPYKVTFMVDEEVYHISESETRRMDMPEAPSKEDFIFLGWYYVLIDLKFDGTLRVNMPSETRVEARWQERQFHINYFVNMNETIDILAKDDIKHMEGYVLKTAVDLTSELSMFYPSEIESIEWYAEPEFINQITEIPQENPKSYNLYGKIIYRQYNITYELYGGENAEGNRDSTSYLESFKLEPARREGSIFLGWYDNPDFTGSTYQWIPYQNSSDMTLYAKWQRGSAHFDYVLSDNGTTYYARLERDADDSNLVVGDYYAEKPVSKILKSNIFVSGEYKLYIPKTINIIEDQAFMGVNITEVTLEEGSSITIIGDEAFQFCPLTKFDMSNVLIIGDRAFAYTKLSGQLAFNRVSVMGKEVFADVTLSRVEFNDTCTIRSFDAATFMKSNIADIRLPSSVETITANTFKGSKFERLYIPATVTAIEEESFRELTALEELVFADDSPVSILPGNSVTRNDMLRKLVLPKCELTVERGAIFSNGKLSVIELDNEIIHMWADSFSTTAGLILLFKHDVDLPLAMIWGVEYFPNYPSNTVSSAGRQLFIERGAIYTVNKNSREAKLVSYGGTDEIVTIPSTVGTEGERYNVRSVLPSAFAGVNTLKTVIIEGGLTTIGAGAFYKCSELATVTLPSTLNNIDEGAFANCGKLTEINLENTQVKLLNTQIFKNCVSLRSIALPSVTKMIYISAFENCRGLERVNFQNVPLELIGAKAFKDCVSLIAVNLSASKVTAIGSSAFENCVSLNSVMLPQVLNRIEYRAFYGTGIREIIFPSAVNIIDSYAFSNSKLRSIHLPESLTKIDAGAFEDCKQLEEVAFSPGIRLSRIDNAVFKGAEKLKSIVIPADCTAIGRAAFYGSGIENLEFASQYGLRNIGIEAFKDCKNLKLLNLPKTVAEIDAEAFENCPIVSMNVPISFVTYSIFNENNVLKQLTVDSLNFLSKELNYYTLAWIQTYYINEDIDDYISLASFKVQFRKVDSDKPGYIKYVKIAG